MARVDHFYASKPTGFGEWLNRAQARALFDSVSRFIPARAAVLEIGPGKGRFARLCRDAGHEYHAVEASAYGCEFLRQQGIDVVKAFVPPLPPTDRKHDLICAWAVLEHMLSVEAATKLVQGARDQLADGGVLAIMSPELKAWGFNFWCDPTHSFPTSAQTTMTLFYDAGLEPVHCSALCGPFFGLKRIPFLVANKLNPWRVEEFFLGPRFPSRRLRNLKLGLSECFLAIGRKPASEQQ